MRSVYPSSSERKSPGLAVRRAWSCPIHSAQAQGWSCFRSCTIPSLVPHCALCPPYPPESHLFSFPHHFPRAPRFTLPGTLEREMEKRQSMRGEERVQRASPHPKEEQSPHPKEEQLRCIPRQRKHLHSAQRHSPPKEALIFDYYIISAYKLFPRQSFNNASQ